MISLRRTAALAVLFTSLALAPAHAQLGLANQMTPGYVVVPSPVFPNYAPTYRAPSYGPPPAYMTGVPPQYYQSGGGMAGSTFDPGD